MVRPDGLKNVAPQYFLLNSQYKQVIKYTPLDDC